MIECHGGNKYKNVHENVESHILISSHIIYFLFSCYISPFNLLKNEKETTSPIFLHYILFIPTLFKGNISSSLALSPMPINGALFYVNKGRQREDKEKQVEKEVAWL